MNAEVNYWWLYDYLVAHTAKSHRGHDDRFMITRITAQEYRDFLKNRDNPNFWKAWNNKAKIKAKSIPFFVKVSGENEPFCNVAIANGVRFHT